MARGRYVAFQNSDDDWLEDKLSEQVRLLEERPEVVACFTEVELIDAEGASAAASWGAGMFTTENRSRFAWLRHFFDTGNCLCISSAMVRADVLRAVGTFRASLIQLSDFDMWIRLAGIGELHIINESLTRMRIVSDASGGRNLSAPDPKGSNRTRLEWARVLENFVQPPILNLLPIVFHDVAPDIGHSPPVLQAWLARHAWSLGSACHALAADRIMEAVLEDEAARAEVTRVFGAGSVRDFVRRRGLFSFHLESDEDRG